MITEDLPAPTPPFYEINSTVPPLTPIVSHANDNSDTSTSSIMQIDIRSSPSMKSMSSVVISESQIQAGRKPSKQRKLPPALEEAFQDINRFNYQVFYKNPVDISKFKIPHLKCIAAYLRLRVSGTKTVLIERILNFFHCNVCAMQIQKIMRGFFVKRSIDLRGVAFKNRSICVNQSDFQTLEPLDEISPFEFFSYTDESNFTYGFNILSLVNLLKRKGRNTTNPYNRVQIPESIIGNIIRLYWYVVILHVDLIPEPDRKDGYENQYLELVKLEPFIRGCYYGFPMKLKNQLGLVSVSSNNISLTPRLAMQTSHLQIMRRNLYELSLRPNQERAIRLFEEIDLLGNYTDVRWFSDLSSNQFIEFYFQLNDLWRYQCQLTTQMRNRLSPLVDPFINLQTIRRSAHRIRHEEILKECLLVMELLVYTAFDIEDRKLGAMLVLMGLTQVSLPARQTMNWLYD
jgi:hypothetical protein